jgi:Outer membrane protein beta-barrel domain
LKHTPILPLKKQGDRVDQIEKTKIGVAIINDNIENQKTVQNKSQNSTIQRKNKLHLSNSVNLIEEKDKLAQNAKSNEIEKVDVNSISSTIEKQFVLTEYPSEQIKNNLDSTAISVVAENKVDPNALEELLKEKEQKPKIEPKLNRWQVSTAIAPVYLGSSSNGSPIDSEFANNPKEYKNTVSYGLGINYDLNSKFSLRTGISNLSLSYNTNDVSFYPDINTKNLSTLNYSSLGATINVQDITATDGIQTVQNGAITQQMNYLEIPFELSYKVLDKKFGIQFISGFSTLFLNNNELMVVSENFSAELGKANNLNSVHFSTNVGVGFKYRFWRSFQANFEPTFKYQINTFSSNDGGFRPYFIGLYSGVSYRF